MPFTEELIRHLQTIVPFLGCYFTCLTIITITSKILPGTILNEFPRSIAFIVTLTITPPQPPSDPLPLLPEPKPFVNPFLHLDLDAMIEVCDEMEEIQRLDIPHINVDVGEDELPTGNVSSSRKKKTPTKTRQSTVPVPPATPRPSTDPRPPAKNPDNAQNTPQRGNNRLQVPRYQAALNITRAGPSHSPQVQVQAQAQASGTRIPLPFKASKPKKKYPYDNLEEELKRALALEEEEEGESSTRKANSSDGEEDESGFGRGTLDFDDAEREFWGDKFYLVEPN
ncbi:hypothetical protein PT974_12298 [Cladobotryum mycophilum]|uniref:Uncharacterized protein n=1 Tax=Cladobotryum mycophilum TaxID=491253 RepID=A0ABR0S7L4_9HYPO